MQETYVNRTHLIAWTLWSTVTAILVASWLVLEFADEDEVAFMLALTAGVLAPAAAVAHLRVYTERVCNLIRNTAAHDSHDRQVRSMR